MEKGPTMLRVETQQSDGELICRLEGRFTGAGAEQVRALTTRCETNLKLIVDLTEILFIDAVGEEVLSLLKRLGAHFLAETSYSLDICERLALPLVGNRNPNMQIPGNSDGRRCRSVCEGERR